MEGLDKKVDKEAVSTQLQWIAQRIEAGGRILMARRGNFENI